MSRSKKKGQHHAAGSDCSVDEHPPTTPAGDNDSPLLLGALGGVSGASDPGNAVNAAFPWKLHEMLDGVEARRAEHVVSWLPDGISFKVHDLDKFVLHVLPRYFRQTKYKSFQRQLNMWGFERILDGPGAGGYGHPHLVRGDRARCRKMKRTRIKGSPDARLKPIRCANSRSFSQIMAAMRQEGEEGEGGEADSRSPPDLAPLNAFDLTGQNTFMDKDAETSIHRWNSSLRGPSQPYNHHQRNDPFNALAPSPSMQMMMSMENSMLYRLQQEQHQGMYQHNMSRDFGMGIEDHRQQRHPSVFFAATEHDRGTTQLDQQSLAGYNSSRATSSTMNMWDGNGRPKEFFPTTCRGGGGWVPPTKHHHPWLAAAESGGRSCFRGHRRRFSRRSSIPALAAATFLPPRLPTGEDCGGAPTVSMASFVERGSYIAAAANGMPENVSTLRSEHASAAPLLSRRTDEVAAGCWGQSLSHGFVVAQAASQSPLLLLPWGSASATAAAAPAVFPGAAAAVWPACPDRQDRPSSSSSFLAHQQQQQQQQQHRLLLQRRLTQQQQRLAQQQRWLEQQQQQHPRHRRPPHYDRYL